MWCCVQATRSNKSCADETHVVSLGAARAVQPCARLRFTPPFDWDFFLIFHRARALPGVEQIDGECYRRTVRCGDYVGRLQVSLGDEHSLHITLSPRDDAALAAIIPRVRRAFDLDADLAPINAHLSQDPHLATLIARRPGLRVAGSVDGFEQAVRAILGQQISVTAARNLGGRLAARWGTPLSNADGDELRYVFPTPAMLADAEIASLGMPGKRGQAVATLGARVAAEPDILERETSLDGSIAKLVALPGLGPWTAHYIAMRVLREPDALPASDIGLLRALTDAHGQRPTAAQLIARAQAWRPWRAYAAQHLWAADAVPMPAL
jgi:AraC family transcriptional regulator of adaptative response / DNA-3-methyladenine glycosylase II